MEKNNIHRKIGLDILKIFSIFLVITSHEGYKKRWVPIPI